MDLLSKDCQLPRSLFDRFFNIQKEQEVDRTRVNRNFDERCIEIASNSYNVMVRVNETVTYSKTYQVSFMP